MCEREAGILEFELEFVLANAARIECVQKRPQTRGIIETWARRNICRKYEEDGMRGEKRGNACRGSCTEREREKEKKKAK